MTRNSRSRRSQGLYPYPKNRGPGLRSGIHGKLDDEMIGTHQRRDIQLTSTKSKSLTQAIFTFRVVHWVARATLHVTGAYMCGTVTCGSVVNLICMLASVL